MEDIAKMESAAAPAAGPPGSEARPLPCPDAPWPALLRGVGHGGGAVFALDTQGRFTCASGGTGLLLGRPAESLPGQRMADLLARPPSDAHLHRLLLGGTLPAAASGYRCETLLHPADGSPLWVQAVLQPAAGLLTVMLTDITSMKVRERLQHRVLDAMAHDLPLPEIAAGLCEDIEAMLPGVAVSVLELDVQNRLRCLAAPRLEDMLAAHIDGQPAGRDGDTYGAAAWRSASAACADVAADPRWAPWREPLAARGFTACWSAPVLGRDGRLLGAFTLHGRSALGCDGLPLHALEAGAQLCALLLERERTQQSFRRLAYQDAVTGLPNRAFLLEATERLIREARREGHSLAIAFIDLDRFKQVNDQLGHRAGDDLLREVAQRLQGASRRADIVARIGGDEFAAVLPHCGSREAAAAARRLLAAAVRPVMLHGRCWNLGASIGIAQYPRDGTNAATLLHHADLAMYAAKRAGGRRLSVFRGKAPGAAVVRETLEG
ncbi:diguanylate cyclase domain-containing protein [Paracidovorax cattleyae]|uniref:Diguanylate cyclase (GGDEF) domain-containing protein n=1 Tax=Paracidovorax cattleyae TaxID=80868 RepID=A0A1H0PJ35_9BURK|nr:diguanylate cyclase [Paracidovorax cattleyae]AVS76568.1 sensor domain-containing diguanylate cyclase [Paracidovorax cattleyae]SDP04616.1 diguanylate cyclase (GGDEF) domain-containing protein [Paracidovorax cattleyae]